MRFWTLMLIGWASGLLTHNAGALEQDRYALVIGNAAYKNARLANPVNDAMDIAKSLEDKGFKVTRLLNASKRQMEEAISRFTLELSRDKVLGLFYFAGHGLELDGDNWLVPIGANINSEVDAKYDSVNAGRVLYGMQQANNGLNLVILDACRNNPYKRGWRSASRGLAGTGGHEPGSGHKDTLRHRAGQRRGRRHKTQWGVHRTFF